MYKYLLATAAVVALATPASARDGSGYVGLELGILADARAEFDLEATDGVDTFDADDAFEFNFAPGRDFDVIGGFDFGLVRAEAELGYKRTKLDTVEIDDELSEDFDQGDIDASGRAKVLSLMGNALFDVVNREDSSLYVGAGVGRARVKLLGETDSAWAWQLIAGARANLLGNLDAGVKYRFFNTRRLDFQDSDEGITLETAGKFRSHSFLLSLIYNFASAAPPPPPPLAPPPPPPPPATQTCPDGSVILATDICLTPQPPPPPPPPPSPGERG